VFLGRFWAVSGCFGATLGLLWAVSRLFLVQLLAFLKLFWDCFGPFCVISELFCTFAGSFGAVLIYLGTVLGCLVAVLPLVWAVMGYF
jgi:hypothetical protein